MGGPGLAASGADIAPHSGAVFISYASADAAVADNLVATLESHGVACWIAPRDVKAGALYADAIVRAISDTKALVLVLSANSVASAHVGKEVERASSKRRPVIALRIDHAPLSPALEYFLGESHWVDARAGGMDAALAKLIAAIREPARTASGLPAVAEGTSTGKTAAVPATSRRIRLLLATGLAVLVVAIAALLVDRLWLAKHSTPEQAAVPAASGPSATNAVDATISEKSIAVLPFVDMSEKSDQKYFADGIAAEIVSVLGSIPGIKVIGRTSSFQFKAGNDDVRQVGVKLQAAYVLQGSVRRSGQHVRITAQLMDARADTQVWSATYDRNVTDVLSIQEEISAGIARALQIAVSANSERSLRRVENADAYDYYLRGLYALDRLSPDSLEQAKGNLEQAIALEPNFVAALEALALTNYEIGEDENVPPHKAWQAARAAAERALQLDKHSATAHGVLGFVYGFDEFDWTRADTELREAHVASQRSPATLVLAWDVEMAEGRLPEATEVINAAVVIDPLNAYLQQVLGWAREFSGDSVGAEAALRRSLVIEPQLDGSHFLLAELFIARGQPEAALRELEGESSADAKDCGLALTYDALGRKPEADAALERLMRVDADLWPFAIAEVYAHRGTTDEAFRWLERAYTARDFDMTRRLRFHPFFKQLHQDRRFADLFRKMNLPE